MSLYQCEQCGCVENTALSPVGLYDDKKLCSECRTGEWHGCFEKRSAEGMVLCSDGYLYHPSELGMDYFKWRVEHQGLKVLKKV